MTLIETRKQELACKTKLTAVTIGHGSRRVQFFAYLQHNEQGEAILPMHVLDRELGKLNLARGATYTVG